MTVPGNLSSPLLATAAAGAAAAANITKSLRFTSGDSANLSRTPSSTSNRKTWTYSVWYKPTVSGGNFRRLFGSGDTYLIHSGTGGSADADSLYVNLRGGATNYAVSYAPIFRDFSAWYHIVWAVDTTQATAADRSKFYVNGVQITDAGGAGQTYPPQNHDTAVNSTGAHYISSSSGYVDGYMTDIYLIDGSQLDPTSFGAFDDNGVWQAAAYSGTYGTNGFHLLDFANESTIGHDSSGNENDFTANNFNTGGTNAHISGSASPSGKSGFQDSYPGDYALDGSDTSQAAANYSAGDTTTVTVTFDPAITAGSTLTAKIYQYQTYHSMKVNSGSFVTASGSVVNLLSGHGVSAGDSISSITYRTVSPNSAFALGNELYYIKNGGTNIVSTPILNDVFSDSPQNDTTNTDSGAGGEVSGNYCILNALKKSDSISTFGDGNLNVIGNVDNDQTWGTIAVSSGKFYFETTITTYSGSQEDGLVGISDVDKTDFQEYVGKGAYSYAIAVAEYNTYMKKYNGNTAVDTDLKPPALGDVIGVAFDLDNGKVWFHKNGVYANSGDPAAGTNAAYTGLSGTFTPAITCSGSTGGTVGHDLNFGQRKFAYGAPTGFKCLNTSSLPTPTIADSSAQFKATLWTGNGTNGRSITLMDSWDLLWFKQRSSTQYHYLEDRVRGTGKMLYSNATTAEEGPDSTKVQSHTADGITVGTDGAVNASNETYVGWTWNAGANSNKTYTVKVVSDSGNKYRFDDHGTSAVTLDLAEGSTYIFDQSDSSNSGHPLRFSTTSDGTHNSGSEYTTGVTATGTPGSAGAKTTIVLGTGVATLYYYCTAHSGMGGQVNTNSTAGSTRLSGSENSAVYDQSQNFTNNVSSTSNITSGHEARLFNGILSGTNADIQSSQGSSGVINFSSAITGSKIEIYTVGNIGQIGINGGNVSVTANQFVDTGVTSLTSVETRHPSAGLVQNPTALRVDGKILVDSNVTPPTIPEHTSIVKANPEAGFSIVNYVGTGANTTVAHGLNSQVEFIIVKSRDMSSSDWCVYHSGLSSTSHVLALMSSGAEENNSSTFNGTAPTNSVFSLGTRGSANGSGNKHIAYCFAPVAGYSAIGSYTGNGSTDGPFVALSFRPAFLLVKCINTAGTQWTIYDASRDPSNVVQSVLWADTNEPEFVNSVNNIDFLSNGFKIRNSHGERNTSGSTYIYYAVAENPFQANGGLAR